MVRLKFKKIGINGEGIGYKDKKPVFCDGVLPEEIAEIEIIEKKINFERAELKKIIHKSNHRRKPKCSYQKECGSCPFMILDEKEQQIQKIALLKESLWKYAHISDKKIRKFHASPSHYFYRSACKVPIAERNGKLVAGMYATRSNRFIPIETCILHSNDVEYIKKEILEVLNQHHYPAYQKKVKEGLRYLVIRFIDHHAQATLITGKDTLSKELVHDLEKIDGLDSLFQSVNTEKDTVDVFGPNINKLFGDDTLSFTLSGLTLELSPRAFFQLNIEQAEKLYQMAVSKIDPCDVLVEAYAGIGAMSLLAHDKATQIYAIESIPEAVENAKKIAKENNIHNIEYLCEDAYKGLYKVARKTEIDFLLVDPPRSGLDDNMIDAIMHILPKKILYISCNPSTLAKNLSILKKNYNILTIQPYDLFPQTPHVETVCLMSLC